MLETLKNKVIAALGGTAPAPPDNTPEAERLVGVAKYFLSLVRLGEIWPKDEWEEARVAYEGSTEKPNRLRANLWRTMVDTQAAFLDQDPKRPIVRPQDGYAKDETARGQAQCEQALYDYIFREMDYASAIEQVRHSAGLIDVGFAVLSWDMRRSLPAFRYLEPEDVRIDPDCGGDLARAGWIAFAENVSAELLSRQAGIPLDKLRKARVKPLPDADQPERDAEEVRRATEVVGAAIDKCRVWHIYARNEFALYDTRPASDEQDQEGRPHFERHRDRHGMNEPRRYVKVVEGYDRPIEDIQDGWPEALALDWDEWPIVMLGFNRRKGKCAGFTDWRHVSVLQEDFNTVLKDLVVRAKLRNPPKMLKGEGCTMDDAQIKRMLESTEVEVIGGAVDATGKPTLVPLDFGTPTVQEVELLATVKNLVDQMSMLPEIMRGGEQGFETATEARTASEAAAAKIERRFRRYERMQIEIARKTIQACHANLPLLTRVERLQPVMREVLIPDPVTGTTLPTGQMEPTGDFEPVVDSLMWSEAQIALAEPGAELVQLGVEAMVGPELARFWPEGKPLSVIRASTRVDVERGSSQRRVREEKSKEFRELVMQVLLPVSQATNSPQMALAIARKCLLLMDVEDVDQLVPSLPEVEAALAAQAAQEQAQAAAPAQESPPPAAAPAPGGVT
jgi:hypothetical protein